MTHIEKRQINFASQNVTAYFMVSDDGGEYPIGYSSEEAEAFLAKMAQRTAQQAEKLEAQKESIEAKASQEEDDDKKNALENDAKMADDAKTSAQESKSFFESLTIPA